MVITPKALLFSGITGMRWAENISTQLRCSLSRASMKNSGSALKLEILGFVGCT
jgi:hypothetical protein